MYNGTPGTAGHYRRPDGPKVNVLNGFDPQNSNFPQILGPIASGETIRSGQLISKNDSGEWIRGYNPAFPNSLATLAFALQDSIEPDVAESNKLTGIPLSSPNIVFQTAWFNTSASYSVQGAPLVPDGTTGRFKPIAGFNEADDFYTTIGNTATNTTLTLTAENAARVTVGDLVTGAGVAANTIVTAKPTSTTLTVSEATTATATGVSLTFQKTGFTFTKAGGAVTADSKAATVTSTLGIRVGDGVTGTGVATGTKVQSVDSATELTLTKAAVTTGSSLTLTIARTNNSSNLPVVGFVSQSHSSPSVQPENVAGPRGRPNITSAVPDENGQILVLTIRSGFIPGNVATS